MRHNLDFCSLHISPRLPWCDQRRVLWQIWEWPGSNGSERNVQCSLFARQSLVFSMCDWVYSRIHVESVWCVCGRRDKYWHCSGGCVPWDCGVDCLHPHHVERCRKSEINGWGDVHCVELLAADFFAGNVSHSMARTGNFTILIHVIHLINLYYFYYFY